MTLRNKRCGGNECRATTKHPDADGWLTLRYDKLRIFYCPRHAAQFQAALKASGMSVSEFLEAAMWNQIVAFAEERLGRELTEADIERIVSAGSRTEVEHVVDSWKKSAKPH